MPRPTRTVLPPKPARCSNTCSVRSRVALNPEHDLDQLISDMLDATGQPVEEPGRFVRAGSDPQGADGEAEISKPGVAVVEVQLAAQSAPAARSSRRRSPHRRDGTSGPAGPGHFDAPPRRRDRQRSCTAPPMTPSRRSCPRCCWNAAAAGVLGERRSVGQPEVDGVARSHREVRRDDPSPHCRSTVAVQVKPDRATPSFHTAEDQREVRLGAPVLRPWGQLAVHGHRAFEPFHPT